mmetsp:Transcript_20830/g.60649  ORF Transcript_20830/g.60649 Transcript_20830/m.60649 type:complete len:220 (+) Transcript_20830:244-903(+)
MHLSHYQDCHGRLSRIRIGPQLEAEPETHDDRTTQSDIARGVRRPYGRNTSPHGVRIVPPPSTEGYGTIQIRRNRRKGTLHRQRPLPRRRTVSIDGRGSFPRRGPGDDIQFLRRVGRTVQQSRTGPHLHLCGSPCGRRLVRIGVRSPGAYRTVASRPSVQHAGRRTADTIVLRERYHEIRTVLQARRIAGEASRGERIGKMEDGECVGYRSFGAGGVEE